MIEEKERLSDSAARSIRNWKSEEIASSPWNSRTWSVSERPLTLKVARTSFVVVSAMTPPDPRVSGLVADARGEERIRRWMIVSTRKTVKGVALGCIGVCWIKLNLNLVLDLDPIRSRPDHDQEDQSTRFRFPSCRRLDAPDRRS